MKRVVTKTGCAFVFALLTHGVCAAAGQAASIDEQALALLKRSVGFISEAGSLDLEIEYEFDVVQTSGEKIEFGGVRRIKARRPDRLRIEFARRDGTAGELVFDGERVILVNRNENVYSTAKHTSDVGAVLDFVEDELGVVVPLRDFLVHDPVAVLTQGLTAAHYGGETTIAGVACDHLAFRTDAVDYQVWVSRDGQPLPQRLVITYREAEGQPQFRARFLKWDIDPALGDALFVHEPARGSEEIPFIAPQALPIGTGGAQ